MKIGISLFGGDGGKSGISQYIIQLLQAFQSAKPECEIELVGYENEREIFMPPDADWSWIGLGSWLKHPVVNITWHQLALPRLARQREWNVLFLPAGNRRLPLRAPCPTVGTVHDFSSLHVEGKYDRARMVYIKKVLPALIQRLTHVITISESSRRDIVEYAGVPAPTVTVIPLAADTTQYHPGEGPEASAAIASKYGIHKPFVLYVSRIEHPGKNHVRLIRAFDSIKRSTDVPYQLVLAGSDWDRAEEVHRVAAESESARDIRFTGFVPSSDLPDFYRAADSFVFPSLYEGFGLPILEAMSSGTPVACARRSSLPEVAGDAALYFDPDSEASMERALGTLLTDTEARSGLVSRGLARSREFSWSSTASRTLEALETAAAR